MEETLYNKMHEAITRDVEDEFNATKEQAKACERVAIHAQIVFLKIINQNLELHVEQTRKFIDNEPMRDSIVYYNGKIEGIKLAVESNQQEINELEKQLQL